MQDRIRELGVNHMRTVHKTGLETLGSQEGFYDHFLVFVREGDPKRDEKANAAMVELVESVRPRDNNEGCFNPVVMKRYMNEMGMKKWICITDEFIKFLPEYPRILKEKNSSALAISK